NFDTHNNKIYASRIDPSEGRQIPDVDPNEPFEHVQVQIADNMQGFVKDFSGNTGNPGQIMKCYTPQSLPFINYLAKRYAVSDAYFSSIPTQTNCNRAFSLTGNSIGYYYDVSDTKVAMVDNYWTYVDGGPGMPYEFTEKTVWNVLSDNGHDSPDKDWAVFYSQTWPGLSHYQGDYCFTQDLLWPNLKHKKAHFKDISHFWTLAGKGKLPKFSYLEPIWYEKEGRFGHTGTDYHPPQNVSASESFLAEIYHTLKRSPKWKNTLLIVNFDEHGGTYDHVEPPVTIAPWENPGDGTSRPKLSPKHPFEFKKLGVRVPLILVSPLIEPRTVFRPEGSDVFDHTSVIATILNYFDIPRKQWGLGSRTANAATFENVIKDPRAVVRDATDGEALEDLPVTEAQGGESEKLANDLHVMIGRRFVWRKARENNFSQEDLYEIFKKCFSDIRTMDELDNAIGAALKHVVKKP
ncbi:MAG TPA: alkaline phosphatase family protein, partial [Gammaproteobacteria bacterium]